MNTVIVHQDAKDINAALDQLRGIGAHQDIVQVPSGDRVHVATMDPNPTLKGVVNWVGYFGYIAIRQFAENLLQNIADDLIVMQVIFIFHQTSTDAARGVTDTMELVARTRTLEELTRRNVKSLQVAFVHLLSCESATDKVAQPPLSTGVQHYVTQAAEMRRVAQRSFIVPKVPPPGSFAPIVVTYTTGDPETGGVTLNPFRVEFRRLEGHFNDDGSWSWDDPSSSDHDGDPTDGTVYNSAGPSDTTQDVQAGQSMNIMGFPPP